MKKESITISVDNNTTKEEIQNIRKQFKQNEQYKNYKLNIIISGHDNLKQNIKNFLKAGLMP